MTRKCKENKVTFFVIIVYSAAAIHITCTVDFGKFDRRLHGDLWQLSYVTIPYHILYLNTSSA